MATTDPLAGFSTKKTHQRHQAPGRPEQIRNNEGGFVFQLDPLSQFKRFLTIGVAGGTFYAGADALTQENGNLILEITKDEELQFEAMAALVEISLAGRAPKQNPTLFALAIFCQHGTVAAKQYARKQITRVVRTGTQLFIFVGYLNQFGGWSMGLRKAVAKWYTEKDPDKLAYQLVKYRSREGWSHRDVLRLSHPKIENPTSRANIDWSIKYQNRNYDELEGQVSPIISGFESAWREGADIPAIISDNPGIPWEGLPDEALTKVETWERLLDNGMPIGALLRQLPRLTKLGLLPQMGGGRTNDVISMLLNPEKLAKARIHPINVLVAMKTYESGRSLQGSGVWTPTTKVIDALDEMFYASFGHIPVTDKRIFQACDVSGSMFGGRYGYATAPVKNFPLTPAEISGAMAMATARVEPNHMIMGFSSKSGYQSRDVRDSQLVDLNISPRQRMDDVMQKMYNNIFGGTDVALPMMTALENRWEVDTFVVYTDNETWHGDIHPHQALELYRQKMGIDARLVVVAATATNFTVADPRDPGMLDIAGFDSAVPSLISDFSARLL